MPIGRASLAAVAACLVALGACAPTKAPDHDMIVIGVKISPTTMDPHISASTANLGNYRHVFDSLFNPDTHFVAQPALATAARMIDPTTWEFDLRRNVRFHDGSAFDAKDVLFSIDRVAHHDLPGSDGLAREMLQPIVSATAVNGHLVRIVTRTPMPDLPKRLTELLIVSNEIGPNATSEDFNKGRAAIGTGPYRFIEWRRGEYLKFERSKDYWGRRPDFAWAILKEQTNDAARVAALETGEDDMIDFVPPLDATRLRKMSDLRVSTTSSGRVIFLRFDELHGISPQVTDLAGRPLAANPLKDLRVRRALSMAINRDLIVDKVMNGFAVKATQAVPAGFGGYDPAIAPPRFNKVEARRLLAEAGYPKGFRITLSCPNDRFIKDASICQAIGQMWSHIGVLTKVDTMPKSIYFKRFLDGGFSAYLLSWGNDLGDSASILTSIVATKDDARGRGNWNVSYSNPRLDGEIEQAVSTVDPALRELRLRAAMNAAIADLAISPIHVQPVIVGMRRGIDYTVMGNETTLAFEVRKQPARAR